jgi:hypothetical protein
MVPPAEAMVSLPSVQSCCPHWLPYLLIHLSNGLHSLPQKILQVQGRVVDGAATPWELEDPLPSEEGRFHGFKGGGKCMVGA